MVWSRWLYTSEAIAKSLAILKDAYHVLGMSYMWSAAFWTVLHKKQAIWFLPLTLTFIWCQRIDWDQLLQVLEGSLLCFGGLETIPFDRNERTQCIMFKIQWHLLFWQTKCPVSQLVSSLFPMWGRTNVAFWIRTNEKRTLVLAVTFLVWLRANDFIPLSLSIGIFTWK